MINQTLKLKDVNNTTRKKKKVKEEQFVTL